jgi:hypothetical protein
MTRRPVNARARKRTVYKAMERKAKRGRDAAGRSNIRLRLATPAPSRGFLRRLLSEANRRMELEAAIARHPAGKGLVAA